MKQFRHKQTGKIVTYQPEGFSGEQYPYVAERIGDRIDSLPAWVVENSQDWKEVKTPLFISEDGVEMFTGMPYWITTNPGFEEPIATAVAGYSPDYNRILPRNRRFSTEAAAKEYIIRNKPIFSVTDVEVAPGGKNIGILNNAGIYKEAEKRIFGDKPSC